VAYILYLDGVALPVAPSKIQTKIQNQNKTLNLINDGEINLLKAAGLTEISFTAMLPYIQYPFAYYPSGFKEVLFYLDVFELLKINKKPFQFICVRTTASGDVLFDTNIRVSLEDYTIEEDASNGQALNVSINLKQYVNYGTKIVSIVNTSDSATAQIAVTNARPAYTAPSSKTYTVKSGDTLWHIAKRMLGDGSRYNEIYNLNKDKVNNPNRLYVGQVLILP